MPDSEAEERQLYAPMDSWESTQDWDKEVLSWSRRGTAEVRKEGESRITAQMI